MVSYHDLSDEEKDRLYHRRPKETSPLYDRQMIALIIAATVIVALIGLLDYASSIHSTRLEVSSSPPITTPK